MAEDLSTQIKISADASGVESGVSRATKSLDALGKAAKKVGQDSATGIADIGNGGDAAAKKVDSATRSIQNSLQRLIAEQKAGSKNSKEYWEALADTRGANLNVLRPYLDQLQDVSKQSKDAANSTKGLSDSFASLGGATKLAAGALAAVGIGNLVTDFVRLADAATQINARLSLVTSSAGELATVQAQLFQIAQNSRVPFEGLAGTYTQIARSAKELGVSQQTLLGVTETISQALTISGTSAASAEAALTQLSQGLASGQLRGEELNSVLEQTPRLAQAIAEGLGLTTGELRKFAEAGQLTADQVLVALQNQAAKVAAEFAKIPPTVGQAGTVLKNSLGTAVGELDAATGASAALAQGIIGVADAVKSLGGFIKDNQQAIQIFTGAIGGAGVVAGLAATAVGIKAVAGAVAALGIAAAANPLIWPLLGIAAAGAAVGGLVAYNNAQKKTAEGIRRTITELEELNKRGPGIYNRSAADMEKFAQSIEARKKQISELRQQLAVLESGGIDNRAEDARFARQTSERARADKEAKDAAAKLLEIRQKLSGVDKDYISTVAEIQRQREAGFITEQESVKLLTELANKNAARTESNKASNKALEEEARLLLEINGLSGTFQKDWDNLANLYAKGKINLEQLTAAQADLLAKQPAIRAAAQEQAAAQEAVTKANVQAAAAREKYVASLESGAEKVRNEAAALREQTERLGLSAQAIAELDAAKLEMLATDLELQAIKALDRNLDEQTFTALRDQAAAYRDLAKAKQEAGAKAAQIEIDKSAAESAKKAAQEWQKASDDINKSLTDALLRGFESGKSFAKNLRDTLKNMFNTLVLRPIISAVLSPVSNIISGILGNIGLGTVAGGAASSAGVGIIGNIGASIVSGITGLGSVVAGTVGKVVGSIFGQGIGNAALLNSLGFGAASSTAAATAAAAAGGASTAGIAGASSIFSSIGSVLGPLAIGVGLLTSLIKGTSGERRSGGQFSYVFDDGILRNNRRGTTEMTTQRGAVYLEGAGFGAGEFDKEAVQNAINGTVSTINATFKALGSSLTLTAFQAGFESSGKGRGGVFAGGTLSSGATFGESGQGDNYAGTLFEQTSTQSPDLKTALENFGLDLKQATIQALQKATDIPQSIKDKIANIDAEKLSNEAADQLLLSINAQIEGVNKLRDAFDTMGLEDLADIAFDAAGALADAAGGFDKLLSNLDKFYQNFYTEEERRANLQRRVNERFTELGITAPQSRDEFRALVEENLRRAEEQDKARKQLTDALTKDPQSIISGGRSALENLSFGGLDAGLLGNGANDPARQEAVGAFLEDLADTFSSGKTPAEVQQSVSELVRANGAILGIGEDAATTAAALLEVSDAFAELNDSAEEIERKRREEQDKALDALRRAVAREREILDARIDAARDSVDTLSDLFNLISDNVREIRAEAIGDAATASIGREFITQALATAQATGYLPDAEQLANAIGSARGGLGIENFSSLADQRFERLRLAGELEALGKLTEEQLTEAERMLRTAEAQLEALNETLRYWEEQLDIAQNGVEATLSVEQAIRDLQKLFFPEQGKEPSGTGGAPASGSGSGAVFGARPAAGATSNFRVTESGLRIYDDGSTYQLTENELDLYRRGLFGSNVQSTAIPNLPSAKFIPQDMQGLATNGVAIVENKNDIAAISGAANDNMQAMQSLFAEQVKQTIELRKQIDTANAYAMRTANAVNGNPEAPMLTEIVT